MKLGFIGLGRMGNRMVTKLLDGDHQIVVWNRTQEKISNFKSQIANFKYKNNFLAASSVKDLIRGLGKPRVIWSMLPSGEPTEQTLAEISKFVEKGDIVVDGGNAYYPDTQKRYEDFKSKGIRFLGIGVSGGVIALKEGYPLMAGGDRSAYEFIKPILETLAKPGGGHEYFGEGGAGHYVKMVHNGIEYGYMQAIGEGFGVLEKSPYNLDLEKVAKLYTKGTLVSGFMMDRTVEALGKDPKLENLEGVIEASGEGEWTINEGKKLKVPVDVIEESFDFRKRSKTDQTISSSFAARLIAALRAAFGRHEVKRK